MNKFLSLFLQMQTKIRNLASANSLLHRPITPSRWEWQWQRWIHHCYLKESFKSMMNEGIMNMSDTRRAFKWWQNPRWSSIICDNFAIDMLRWSCCCHSRKRINNFVSISWIKLNFDDHCSYILTCFLWHSLFFNK